MRSSSGPLSRRRWRRMSGLAAGAPVPHAGKPARARVRRRHQHERASGTRARAGRGRSSRCRPRAAGAAPRVVERWNSDSSSRNRTPAVRERRLPRPRRRAAADQSGGRDRVVRRAERPRGDQPVGVQPGDAVDPGHLDRLGPRHRAAGSTAAGARASSCRSRAGPRAAGCGRRRRRSAAPAAAARGRGRRPGRARPALGPGRAGAPAAAAAGAPVDDLGRGAQARARRRPRGPSTSAASRARSRGTISRGSPARARALGDGQRARRVAQLAAERQLAEHRVGGQRVASGSARWRRAPPSASAASKPGPDLAQERRREVGGDPRCGELEAPSSGSPRGPGRATPAPRCRRGRRS